MARLLLLLLPCCVGLWLREEGAGPVSSAIVGLFDTVTGLTHTVGGLVGEVGDGFDDIKGEEGAVVVEKVGGAVADCLMRDVGACPGAGASAGSQLVVGVFDALQDLTRDVGDLVGTVEEVLGTRRGDVVDLADRVEENVDTLHTRLTSYFTDLRESGRNVSLQYAGVRPTESSATKWKLLNITRKPVSKVEEVMGEATMEEASMEEGSVEPTIVEQSVLAGASSFIQIGDTEEGGEVQVEKVLEGKKKKANGDEEVVGEDEKEDVETIL